MFTQTFYNVLLGIAIFVAVVFSLLIYLTGKGDAMSGGTSSIRTSFKGKASFDDKISQFTLYMGVAFMVLMVVLDLIAVKVFKDL